MDKYKLKPVMASGLWRVDGVSKALWNGSRMGLQFVFSQIAPDAAGPYSVEAYVGCGVVEQNLSAQWLSVFTTGSIWQKGGIVGAPEELTPHFEIDISRTVYKPFNFHMNVGGVWDDFVKPAFLDQKIHTALAPSLYSFSPIIGHKKYKWMVIPCSELLRFYMAPTRRLADAVLNGEIPDLLSSYSVQDDTVTLFDRVGLTRYEALILGRVYANEATYLQELLDVRKRLVHANIERQKIKTAALSVDARFPIKGTTKLKVAGVPMSLAGGKNNAIFAMEILFCESPPGYSELILRQSAPKKGGEKERAGSGKPKFQPVNEDNVDKIVTDGLADARLPRRIRNRFISPPWGDSITVHCQRNDNPENWGTLSPPVRVDGRGYAAGDGSHAGADEGKVGIDFNTESLPAPNSRIATFLEMIEFLEKTQKNGWVFNGRTLNEEIAVAERKYLASQFPLDVGRRWKWHLIDGRPRQLACIEVSITGKEFFYILEMEYRTVPHCTALLRAKDFGNLSDEQLSNFLKLTIYCNGWPEFDQATTAIKKALNESATYMMGEIKKDSDLLVGRIKHPKHPIDLEKWSGVVLSEITDWLRG